MGEKKKLALPKERKCSLSASHAEENAFKSPALQQNCKHWLFHQLNCFDWLQNKKNQQAAIVLTAVTLY